MLQPQNDYLIESITKDYKHVSTIQTVKHILNVQSRLKLSLKDYEIKKVFDALNIKASQTRKIIKEMIRWKWIKPNN